jgi:hypothetical protein
LNEGVDVFSLSWILDPETYNPSYPFTAYSYLIVIAIVTHLILVIWPMIKIYRRFTKDRLKSIVKEVKKALTEEQKIELMNWIKSEIIFMLVPFLIALLFRLLSGSPNEFEWTNLTLIVGLALATIWMSLQIWQAIEMNRILNPLLSKWKNPKLISGSLGLFNITKSQMEILSKLEPEYHERTDEEIAKMESMVVKDEEGKLKLDSKAIASNAKEMGKKTSTALYNVGQLGKSLVGKINKKTVQIVDEKIQKQVDELTKPTLHTQLKAKVITVTLAFLPLIAIYYILPYMS